MAEEVTAPVAVDAPKPAEDPTRSAETADGAVAAEAKPEVSGDVAPADAPAEEQAPKAAAATDDQATKDEATDAKPDTTAAESSGDVAPAVEASTEASATNGTPASAKKANNNRRKSTGGGVPEHKSKKTPSKKKKAPEMHLDTVPGDMWMVAMRGYQPWPVIICDEEMLPESLISKRPVSAKRIDGTYRDDFLEGGKNAKDRRYPVMFLGTNEFAWQVNTELLPFNMEDVKKEVEAGNNAKKNKNLWDAYLIASEGHDLAWFKNMLIEHEQAIIEDAEAKAAKQEEKAKKAEKAAKRKSTAAAASEDVEMEDVGDDAAASAKKSKKRKKDDDSDGEPEKTPKTKLKLTNKPKDASTSKPKKESKSKKSKSSEDEAEPAPAEEPPMTEAERLQKREKSVLYLRHRLQKGFISRDQAPKDEDMPAMSNYLKQLEELEDLEAEVIKNTKVHKVLKAIVKLNSIPQEEVHKFKERSNNLLTKFNGALSAASEPTGEASAPTATPTTNGVKHDEETKADASEPGKTEKASEISAASEAAKPADGEGDVSMAEAPASKADAAPAAPTTESAAETTATETAAA